MCYVVSRVYGTGEVGNLCNFRFLCVLCMEELWWIWFRMSLVKFHCCTLYSVVVSSVRISESCFLGFIGKGFEYGLMSHEMNDCIFWISIPA